MRTRPQPVGLVLRAAAERAAALRDGPVVEVAGPDAPVAIDRERLDQVLANLIANARNAGARWVRLRTRVDEAHVEAHGGTLAFTEPDRDDLPGAALRLVLPRAEVTARPRAPVAVD